MTANCNERDGRNKTSGQPRRQKPSWSGASILGARVTIATIYADADGSWTVDVDRSGSVELQHRDQISIRTLQTCLDEFLAQKEISRLYLRTTPGRRPQLAKVETHICEAALCLIPRVTIEPISAVPLSHWLKASGYEIRGQMRDRAWQYAWAAALYGANRNKARIGGHLQIKAE